MAAAPSPSRRRAADPAFELIFLLAGGEARRAARRDRTRAALARVDFRKLAAELAERRLLPLVGTRALEAGGDLCPPSFQATVSAALAAARARGLAVEAATRQVASLLAAAGMPALPLKGPLLADAAHGDIGLRETGDVDLLVPRARLGEASGLLAAEGFLPPRDPLRANGLPDLHLALHHPRRPTVELHWRVHWQEEGFAKAMLDRAAPGPAGLLEAQPDDVLTALLLFYARDGFQGVRLAADIAAWWDRHGHGLPPNILEPHARRHPELAGPLTAAARAVEHVTGTPAPSWLGGAIAAERRVAVASRLADWAQVGDRDQLAANISLADALLTPAAGAPAFVQRELVPRAGPAAPHALKMISRYAVALWRLRGGRLWTEPAEPAPARLELLGLPLDALTEAEVVGHVVASLAEGRGGWVITSNLDHLRQLTRSPGLAELFEEADLVVADGMPLAWASRLAGTPLPERVAGSDLIWSLTAEAALRGRSVFLLGGAPGACDRAAAVLRECYPGLRVAGTHAPPYGFEDDAGAMRAIHDELRAAAPDIVYVGLGFPKQERLIRGLRGELPEAWFLGVGISFSFVAGDVARAPDWVQRIGLEWLHRLVAEPRRLARRYLLEDPPFALRLGVHSLSARARGGLPARPARPERSATRRDRVVFTHGALERRRASDVASLVAPDGAAANARVKRL